MYAKRRVCFPLNIMERHIINALMTIEKLRLKHGSLPKWMEMELWNYGNYVKHYVQQV